MFLQSDSLLDVEVGSTLKDHGEVTSEVKGHPEALSSPLAKSEGYLDVLGHDHMISRVSSDSSGSSDVFFTIDTSIHTNGSGHAHHVSSPASVELVAIPISLPAVPSLLGQSHSSANNSSEYQHTAEHTHITDSEPLDASISITYVEPPPLPDDMDINTHTETPVLTEEEETLFNELMTNSSMASMEKKISYTDFDWGDPSMSRTTSTCQEQDTPSNYTVWSHGRTDSDTRTITDYTSRSSSVDEGSTPRASPYTSPSTIRRWSVKKRRSYDCNDPDEVTTPKSSPYIRRHHSSVSAKYNSHTSSSSTGSEHSIFSPPALDPPNLFRNPVNGVIETLGPCPDELLESSEADRDTERYSLGMMNRDHRDRETEIAVLLGKKDVSNLIPATKAPTTNDTLNNREHSRPNTLPRDTPFHSKNASNPIPTEPHSTSEADSRSSSKKSHSSGSVKRSHSFGSTKRLIVHRREGSMSTDNSPLPSPKFKANKSDKHRRTKNKGSPALSFAASFLGGQRVDRGSPDMPHIHIDTSILSDLRHTASSPGATSTDSMILPPPTEFKGSSDYLERSASRASSIGRDDERVVEKEERSILSFFRIKHGKKGARSTTPSDLVREDKRAESTVDAEMSIEVMPTEQTTHELSTSNDMLSFDEALDSFDQYSSHTGKTARSAKQEKVARDVAVVDPSAPPPSSPSTGKKDEKKKKTKKKKRHGYTVANIDSDTMKEVQRNLARSEAARSSDSRVHQLAREYSQRIKEKSRDLKKRSIVYEDVQDSSIGEVPEPTKPEWLAHLKEKKRRSSMENVLHDETNEGECSSISSDVNLVEPHPPHSQNEDDFDIAIAKLRVENGNQTRQRHTLGHIDRHSVWMEEDEVKMGKLKGWVRSLAAKFGKKEGTTL